MIEPLLGIPATKKEKRKIWNANNYEKNREKILAKKKQKYAKKLAALAAAAAISSSGCATFVNNPIIPAGCQAADAITTVWGLHAGLTEAGLMAGLPPGIGFAIKAIFAYGVYDFFKHRAAYYAAKGEEPSGIDKVGATGIAALGCGAAVHNLLLINGLP